MLRTVSNRVCTVNDDAQEKADAALNKTQTEMTALKKGNLKSPDRDK